MKVAALDLGTNSFLCLICEVQRGQIIRIYDDQVRIVRLGQDVNKTKQFHPDALSRADQALSEFSKTINQHKPEVVLAMATSAARDVTNSQDLFNIGAKYNIPIEIIPGGREAEITFAGTLSGEKNSNLHQAVVDIGGGSTEFISGTGGRFKWGKSLNIGCVRLTEKLVTQQPPGPKAIEDIRMFVRSDIEGIFAEIFKNGKLDSLIAVAGTPTELARVEIGEFNKEKIDEFKFDLEKLESWIVELAKRTPTQITEDLKINPGRADVMLVGAIILSESLRASQCKSLKVSTRGVRFGVALEVEKRTVR